MRNSLNRNSKVIQNWIKCFLDLTNESKLESLKRYTKKCGIDDQTRIDVHSSEHFIFVELAWCAKYAGISFGHASFSCSRVDRKDNVTSGVLTRFRPVLPSVFYSSLHRFLAGAKYLRCMFSPVIRTSCECRGFWTSRVLRRRDISRYLAR